MKTTDYNGFKIETFNGISYIFLNGNLQGCTSTDWIKDEPGGIEIGVDNSEEKAMNRIDSGKINFLSSK
jgi:hypothetical protein